MRIPRIFQAGDLQRDLTLMLEESAAKHLISVLRFKEGHKLILFNGNGYDYPAVITQIASRKVEVTITDSCENNRESSLQIHLGQVISKGERMEYTLQKATELGVTEITPLFSERCDVHLKGERLDRKMQHWLKILISACEQCGRARIPSLNRPTTVEAFAKLIQQDKGAGQDKSEEIDTKVFLDHRAEKNLKDISLGERVVILIGPEGGLSPEEKAYVTHQGFVGVRLGPRVLRTETAGMVALSLVQFIKGDLT